jgi:hypothetical protein
MYLIILSPIGKVTYISNRFVIFNRPSEGDIRLRIHGGRWSRVTGSIHYLSHKSIPCGKVVDWVENSWPESGTERVWRTVGHFFGRSLSRRRWQSVGQCWMLDWIVRVQLPISGCRICISISCRPVLTIHPRVQISQDRRRVAFYGWTDCRARSRSCQRVVR